MLEGDRHLSHRNAADRAGPPRPDGCLLLYGQAMSETKAAQAVFAFNI
jgi:hypothetical protein